MNMFHARIERSADGAQLVVGAQCVTIDAQELILDPGIVGAAGKTVVVGVRPERLGADSATGRTLRGPVLLCEALGSGLVGARDGGSVSRLTHVQLALANDVEDAAEVEELSRERDATVVARVDPRAAVDVDQPIELTIAGSTDSFHSESGLALR